MIISTKSAYIRGTPIPVDTKLVAMEFNSSEMVVKVLDHGDGHKYLLYRDRLSTGEVYSSDELKEMKVKKWN